MSTSCMIFRKNHQNEEEFEYKRPTYSIDIKKIITTIFVAGFATGLTVGLIGV